MNFCCKNKISIKYLSVAIVTILLSGCSASVTQELPLMPADNASCCESLKQLSFVPLKETEALNVSLDNHSAVFNFDEGSSYSKSFVFSPRTESAHVTIKLVMQNGQVFSPNVLLLNKNYEVVEKVTYRKFKTQSADLTKPSQLVANFDTKNVRYMVIYADRRKLGSKIVIPHPAKVRAKEFGEPMPMVTDPVYQRVAVGKLIMSIHTTQYASYASDDERLSSYPIKASNSGNPQQESVTFYHQAIRTAIADNDVDKAMGLLRDAEQLGITDADQVFRDAMKAQLDKQ
ncbi:MalM family protein [Salinivibrio kushneri]|uniref:MalM family protein n=1 Tax=Salinivibrio kushneri TaxID=1908198 RepID=UPI000C85D812|nr:MalM family protein [Salinivibrio kushneri]